MNGEQRILRWAQTSKLINNSECQGLWQDDKEAQMMGS